MYQQTNMNETLASQGDAINELFAQRHKASLRTTSSIFRPMEDSEDAVSTAHCAALRHFHSFRGESPFKTWFTRMVVNCGLMQLRENRARPRVALEDIQRAPASNTATPETLCYLAESQAAHKTAASRRPKGLHDIYAESAISGIAFPKVADQLGLTASAAKSRLFRARKRVERSLQSTIQRRAA